MAIEFQEAVQASYEADVDAGLLGADLEARPLRTLARQWSEEGLQRSVPGAVLRRLSLPLSSHGDSHCKLVAVMMT